MDRLAIELLINVFSLACTDGGYTGCSLSLVCKHFNTISRPLRFQSIAINGSLRKLERFVSRLHSEHALRGAYGSVPVVRHLFLFTLSMPPLAIPDKGSDSRDDYFALVATLMRLVAPKLETLTFLQCKWDVPLTLPFPRLRELTVGEGVVSLVPRAWDGAALYPTLERLHLVSNLPFIPYGRADIAQWARFAPALSHLRVSEFDWLPIEANLDLARAPTPEQEQEQTESARVAACFPRLHRVVLQPCPAPATPRAGSWEALAVSNRFTMDLCRRSWATARVLVCLLPAATDRSVPTQERCVRQAREDWEARLNGQMGCWDVPDLPAYLAEEVGSPAAL
ncbi:hypothetical protein BD413DRAFT_463607 [Trametes elegans]|nr:hypothetical protein BD413DRAFT_463607 [Trametes elegans]